MIRFWQYLSLVGLVLTGFAPAQEREVYNTPKALRRPSPPPVKVKATEKAGSKVPKKPVTVKPVGPGPKKPSIKTAKQDQPFQGTGNEIDLLRRRYQQEIKGPGKPGTLEPTTPVKLTAPVATRRLPVQKPRVAKPASPPDQPDKVKVQPQPSIRQRDLYPLPGKLVNGSDPVPAGGQARSFAKAPEKIPGPVVVPAEKAGPQVHDYNPISPAKPKEGFDTSCLVSPNVPGMIQSGKGSDQDKDGNHEAAQRVLEEMLEARGGRAAFLKLLAIQLTMRITVFNEITAEVFTYKAKHDLLVGKAPSDRITLEEGLVIGRRGNAAWTEIDGVHRMEKKQDAAGELQVMGFLARFPFVLGDRRRFKAISVGDAMRGKIKEKILVVEEKRLNGVVQHRVFLDPVRMVPRQIRYVNSAGNEISVIFYYWRNMEGVELPYKREILGPGKDSIAMEFELLKFELGYFKHSHFLPRGDY